MRTPTVHKLLVLGSSVFSLLVVTPAVAQMTTLGGSDGVTNNGVPPSVTSFGFGGSPGFHGVPSSVTSLNFGNPPFRIHPGPFGFGHHFRRPVFATPFFGNVVSNVVAVPVYVMEPGVDDSMEQEDYRGGPTIFDRRGPGAQAYARPEPRREEREQEERKEREEDYRVSPSSEPTPQQVVPEQPRTVLVFKDGHEQEISNYAIVGSTLYDLSDGRAKKVALAELDLQSTVKQNDSRGIGFQVPAAVRSN
jgi:hypothetical protein